jgi:protein-S-isoprenylcysteine O-methyltransferase Ste14
MSGWAVPTKCGRRLMSVLIHQFFGVPETYEFPMNLPVLQPWNVVFLIGFLAYLGIRHEFGRRTAGNEKIVRRVDGLEIALLVVVCSGSLLLPVVYLFTPWLSFADYRLPAWAPWCGTAAMIAALWLFWRSHADLGLNWSVTLEMRKDHQLVTHGVYRWIRHPMYASIWLFAVAQALLLENWLAGWSACVTFAPLYFVRTPREERLMCEVFGQEYRDYMGRTGRLLPRVKRKKDAAADS